MDEDEEEKDEAAMLTCAVSFESLCLSLLSTLLLTDDSTTPPFLAALMTLLTATVCPCVRPSLCAPLLLVCEVSGESRAAGRARW